MSPGEFMNPIDQLFEKLHEQKKKAFMPFLTTGDPDVKASLSVATELVRRGAHLLEIGFPYSDAIADGPVIQASYTRALDNGLTLNDVFGFVKALSETDVLKEKGTPLVAMLSFSLVHRMGIEKFIERGQSAGLSGAIVPDLPFEESEQLRRIAAERDFCVIQLVTPLTPRERAKEIIQGCTGFLYCVSVAGITGERDQLPEALKDQLAWLREQTQLPLCVGFGISKPDHVGTLKDHVDGVIVGSAIVRRMEQIGERSLETVTSEIGDLTESLVQALE